MRRLFTFGCSFTNYVWPTWADIIGTQFSDFQNWGKSGAGNYYISSKLYECHTVNQITKDDVILIMFSSIDRFDYIDQNSNFITMGSVYGNSHRLSRDFVMDEWSDEFGLYNSWYSILSVKTLLDSIGCEYELMKAFDFDCIDGPIKFEKPKNENNRIKGCLNSISKILSGECLIDFHVKTNQHYHFDDLENNIDGHPPISVYLDWVKKHMKKYYVKEMDFICEEWEKKIKKNRRDMEKPNETFLDFTETKK